MTNKKTSQQANNVNESLGKKTHNFPRVFIGKLLGWHWQRFVLFERIIIRQIDKKSTIAAKPTVVPNVMQTPKRISKSILFYRPEKKKTWGASGKKEKQNQTPNELELELKLILQKNTLSIFYKKSFE